MPCTRVSRRARAEQDYYLQFADEIAFQNPTEEERLDFLRYDSHGTPLPPSLENPFPEIPYKWTVTYRRHNPILAGKIRYGQQRQSMHDSYFALDGSWEGGYWLVQDFLEKPCNIRPLVEWYGPEAVERWLDIWAQDTFDN